MLSTRLRTLPLLALLALGACASEEPSDEAVEAVAAPADSIAPAPDAELVPGADEPGPQEDGRRD